ncbi:MAG: class B sortase [Bacillus sp. (in: Bacteria)]|nr:class B sortase [Bacillus sp. (in: firmicutes)]MCM1427411.1 class B sortase [Eubacterium sp.]
MADFNVAGRQFRTQSDYNAAMRDQKQIEAIKAKINMEQPGEVISLAEELKAGKYRLITIVGTDFKEEIQELAEKYRKQGYTKDSKIKVSKQKKKQTKPNKKDSKKPVSLDAYDEKMQQEIKAVLKQKERKRKLIVVLCSIVALACFGYYGVYYYFADRTQSDYEELADLRGNDSIIMKTPTIHYTEEEEEVELTVLDEYAALYNKNKRLIGWLKIDGTNIDYPVMQTTNNEYYLDHNYNQEYDKNGSLFLDASCDVVHRNTNLIIYGHHMKSGKMFGNLNQYSSENYGKKHSIIQFDTIYEKGTYEVMYVFRSRIYNEDEIVFKYYQFFDATSEREFNSNMNEMAAIALYDTGVTASYGDELLTLSTCDSSETDGRFVVVAKRIS